MSAARKIENAELFRANIRKKLGKFFDKLDARFACQINFDRAFVAVRAEIVGSFFGVVARLIFQVGWCPGARIVTELRTLNLDDIGTQISEILCAERAC